MNIVKQLLGLCRHWWFMDRVRTSPGAGALLRLQPGNLLTIEGQDVLVESRRLHGDDPVSLEFICSSSGMRGMLNVTSIPEWPYVQACWTTSDSHCEISPEGVQIWSDAGTLKIED